MMRIVILIFYFFFLSNLKGYSHNVFPSSRDSISWNVCYSYYIQSPLTYNSYTDTYDVYKDTVICGEAYSIVVYRKTGVEVAYFRSDSGKVYIREDVSCSGKDYLMYDFTMDVGDTVYCGWNIGLTVDIDTTSFWLVSVDTIDDKRIFNMEYIFNTRFPNGSAPMKWIEGFGSEIHPFYPMYTNFDGSESYYESLCNFNFMASLDSSICFCDTTIYLSDNQSFNQRISVYPNPTSDKLYFELSSQIERIEIFDLNGKRVIISNKSIVSIIGIPNGVYVYNVELSDGDFYKGKFIKK